VAPEIIRGETYDGREVDIYSLGVVLFEMMYLRTPFQRHTSYSETILGRQNFDIKRYGKPGDCSQELIDLCGEMMSYDPAKRPGLLEILKRDVIKNS